nr:hypothetical protein L7610.9 - Leishmania major [Leishmania major]
MPTHMCTVKERRQRVRESARRELCSCAPPLPQGITAMTSLQTTYATPTISSPSLPLSFRPLSIPYLSHGRGAYTHTHAHTHTHTSEISRIILGLYVVISSSNNNNGNRRRRERDPLKKPSCLPPPPRAISSSTYFPRISWLCAQPCVC